MNASKVIPLPQWSTASFDDTTDSLPMELSALGQHMDSCQGARGRWFRVRSIAETCNRFVVSRIVTTLVVGTALLAAGLVVF